MSHSTQSCIDVRGQCLTRAIGDEVISVGALSLSNTDDIIRPLNPISRQDLVASLSASITTGCRPLTQKVSDWRYAKHNLVLQQTDPPMPRTSTSSRLSGLERSARAVVIGAPGGIGSAATCLLRSERIARPVWPYQPNTSYSLRDTFGSLAKSYGARPRGVVEDS